MNYSINDLMEYIDEIPDEKIREWTKKAIENCPDDFWTVPASSSGRYHPKNERLEGGTVIHTIRTIKVMKILINAEEDRLSESERSVLLSAALLHDICRGAGKSHAEAIVPYYREKLGKKFVNQQPIIMKAVTTHMGRWGQIRPDTVIESLVHYADNIAAKLHILFPEGDPDTETLK